MVFFNKCDFNLKAFFHEQQLLHTNRKNHTNNLFNNIFSHPKKCLFHHHHPEHGSAPGMVAPRVYSKNQILWAYVG